MAVGRADHPELEGVHPDPFAFAHAFDQRITREVEPRLTAPSAERAPARAFLAVVRGLLRELPDLLEAAQLVFASDYAVHPVGALGLALHLHHLDQPLDPRADSHLPDLLVSRFALPGRLEEPAVRHVRVVGDRDDLAVGAGIRTEGVEPVPEVDRVRGFEGRDGELRDARVTEDHVAMDLRHVDRVAVLPTVEGGEGAGFARVVPALCCAPRLAPGRLQRGAAGRVSVAADLAPAPHHADDAGHLPSHLESGERRLDRHFASESTAGVCVVSVGARGRAEVHLADPLGVVGDRGEVEGAGQTSPAIADAVFFEGTESDRLAPREAVSVVGRGEHPARAGVHRELRVDVEVAEERLAKRGTVGGPEATIRPRTDAS